MKTFINLILIVIPLMLSTISFGQAPEGINYQATVRNSSGALMTNQSVAVIFAVRQTSAIGTIVYQESHTATTNSYGGFSAVIGGGTATTGTFSSINWGTGAYYLNVTVNGNNLGTTQLISVPYALYAKTSGSSTPGPAGPQGPTGPTGPTGNTGPQGPAASDDQDIDSLTLNGNMLTVHIENGTSASTNLSHLQLFELADTVVRTPNGYDSLNFVFGSPQLNDDGSVNHGNKFFFHKKKGAFRAGSSNLIGLGIYTTDNWDEDSLGNYSFGSGLGTKASGNNSTAMGFNTTASGFSSTAMGNNTTASGNSSTVMGFYSTASGNYSTAMGNYTTASGDYSNASGYSSNASGYYSTALGYFSSASGDFSTAMGDYTTASGDNSTALGRNTIASGDYSTALGRSTTASGDYSAALGYFTTTSMQYATVIGKYNANLSGLLFTVGNGTSSSNRLNSMHIFSGSNNAYFRGNIYPMVSSSTNLGSSLYRFNTVYATNGTINTSDTTLKTNIQPLSYGLNELMNIKTISYHWKDDERKITKIGFNAQNLLQIIPEVVQTHSEVTNEDTGEVTYEENETLGVFYSDMIPVLTKSIQEQQEIIQKQKAENEMEVEELKKKLENQQKELEELKKQLQMLLENNTKKQ